MDPLFLYGIYILSALLLGLLIYVLLAIPVLTHRLKCQNLQRYILILGENFQCRPIDNGCIRCKWTTTFFTIRASFDQEGERVPDYVPRLELNHLGLIVKIACPPINGV